ncbi:MAG: hypothetical protein ACIALR_09660 [Blastopirellula sp. JB062]
MSGALFLIACSAVAQVELPAKVAAGLKVNANNFSNLRIDGAYTREFIGAPQSVIENFKTLETPDEFSQDVRFSLLISGGLIRETLHYLPGEQIGNERSPWAPCRRKLGGLMTLQHEGVATAC